MKGPLHFAFHVDAIKTGKAPDCGDGPRTDELGAVTCTACSERIREIVQEWVDGLEGPDSDGETTEPAAPHGA